jgi:hypothetical protein
MCPISLVLFSIVLQFLPKAIRQEKETKAFQIGKEKVKLFLFADMILYFKDTKDSTKKVLDLINTFSNVTGYKINIQMSIATASRC